MYVFTYTLTPPTILIEAQDHDKYWSLAEQASTEHGKSIADAKGKPTGQQNRWYQFTQLFRWIMRNRTATKIAVAG